MGFVFDSVTVLYSDGSVAATVARRSGPLEIGAYVPPGTWTTSGAPTVLGCGGFGIDSSGNAYFDTAGPSEGEEATLSVNAGSFEIWVER